MIKHNQEGATNGLLLPLIVSVILFIAALGFGFWAFGERQTYKNDTDAIVADAVLAAKEEEAAQNAKQFAEEAKLPLKTYKGPSQFGSLTLQYPKTWSGYVATGDDSLLDGYFHPDVVPSVADENSTFALRVKVLSQPYSEVLSGFDGQQGVTITPYALPKVPRTIGARIQGQIEEQKQGDMILLPLRNTTLQIFTQSKDFENDFNTSILPNIVFAP